MPMKAPPHPGRSIKDVCLEALELNVTEAAKVLGVARHTLSRVINGKERQDALRLTQRQMENETERQSSPPSRPIPRTKAATALSS